VSYGTEHIDDLIGKYLAGEAAQDEIHFLESWAGESHENKKYLDHCKFIFDKTVEVKDLQEFDADAAWSKVRSKLLDTPQRSIGKTGEHSQRNFYWMAAASVILILGLGFFAYNVMTPGTVGPVEVETEEKPSGKTQR
jgi:hypothetical protein